VPVTDKDEKDAAKGSYEVETGLGGATEGE
jgi:hypothetical protein